VDLVGASWDTIPAAAVPIQQDSFALLLSILLEPDEARAPHRIDVTVTRQSGEQLGGMTVAVAPISDERLAALDPGEPARVETVVGARGMVYPDYGRYEITIDWDGEPLREPMRFRVTPIPPDESPEASD
jgi:hypothetical protein